MVGYFVAEAPAFLVKAYLAPGCINDFAVMVGNASVDSSTIVR
jgi:hypothetical protein